MDEEQQSVFEPGEWDLSYEEKVFIAEEFLSRYSECQPQDIYRWLWEGEFGPGSHAGELSLEALAQHLRRARMHRRRENLPVCENLGLANVFVKINLAPYVDAGCPLKRLLMLEERNRDVRPDPLRFKKDWGFMKTQITPGMRITLEMMNRFEASIAFHMSPETEYSEDFRTSYGLGYRVAPREAFFQYFPEYVIANRWRS